MDVRDYFLLLRRHWIVFLAAVTAGLLAAAGLILAATPAYEAQARVVFTAHDSGTGQDLAYAGTYVQSRIQTYKDLATSDAVLGPVIDTLDLDESVADLADRTEIEVSQIDTVVGIAVSDPDAEDATRAADAIATALIEAVSDLEGVDETAPRVAGLVVDPAVEPESPAHPDKVLYLLSGLLAGLLVGFAVVTVRHLLRATDAE